MRSLRAKEGRLHTLLPIDGIIDGLGRMSSDFLKTVRILKFSRRETLECRHHKGHRLPLEAQW